MSDEHRQPIGEVLPGFTLHPLDAGCTPSQAFVLIKTVDQDGASAWSFRTSEWSAPGIARAVNLNLGH